jgi:hypothetical protein
MRREIRRLCTCLLGMVLSTIPSKNIILSFHVFPLRLCGLERAGRVGVRYEVISAIALCVVRMTHFSER